MNPFIHLRLQSAYSLAQSSIKIEKLVQLCTDNNMPAVAVTDNGNLFGAMEYSHKLSKAGIQPIIGCKLNISDDTQNLHQLLLLAQNQTGYDNLKKLSSAAFLGKIPCMDSDNKDAILYEYAHIENTKKNSQEPHICKKFFREHTEGLIALSSGIYGELAHHLLSENPTSADRYLAEMKEFFPNNFYIEIMRHGLSQENQLEEHFISIALRHNLPLVATNNVLFPYANSLEAYEILLCIAEGNTLMSEDRTISNREYFFKSSKEMWELFQDIPEAYDNTSTIAQRCSFWLTAQKPILPNAILTQHESQEDELRDFAKKGLDTLIADIQSRGTYPIDTQQYDHRLEYELDMIIKMGFAGYFLIVSDYVRWAKDHDIPVGPGRGSGAGSIVAWSLGITEVDPIYFGLFFERFLNPDRVSLPDFDIDFCQEHRDKVIQYIIEKYQFDNVAQIITFGKLQARAVLKDVGRAMALPYSFVDNIAKMVPFIPTHPLTLQEAIDSEQPLQNAIAENEQVKTLVDIALQLEGLYRHTSVHAAGIVIADMPILHYSPLYIDPNSSMLVTQFSMKFIEDAQMVKFDFLGLKTLTVIQKTLDLINAKHPDQHLTRLAIPLDDTVTFQLLQEVYCVGVFQVESAGMRDAIRKLRPDTINDIIALVALYRPGPMESIPQYIACKHGEADIEYLDPKLEPILQETYGVMVYQEQVMRIAQDLAGYTSGQADLLRRAMGKKEREEMKRQRIRFIDGAMQNGISQDIAEQIFDLMSKFASYGFNKSHATPYGLLTYYTAYLKANYTLEFFASVMTLDMHDTDKLAIFSSDIKVKNFTILPPDINISDSIFTIDYGNNALRYAFAALKGCGTNFAEQIVKERIAHGPYSSIHNFVKRNRSHLNKKSLEPLICSGAFDTLHNNRKQLFCNIESLLDTNFSQMNLFMQEELSPSDEWSIAEQAQHEFLAFGFHFASHPLDEFFPVLQKNGVIPLTQIEQYKKCTSIAKIVSLKRKKTKNQTPFCIVQLSDPSGEQEITFFDNSLIKHQHVLQEGNVIMLTTSAQIKDERIRVTPISVEVFEANRHMQYTFYSTELPPEGQIAFHENIKSMHIKIMEEDYLPQLRLLQAELKYFAEGNVTIEIHIRHTNTFVTMPQKYYISVSDYLQLKHLFHNITCKD